MSWLDEEVLGQATVLDLILFIVLMVAAIVVAKFVNQLIAESWTSGWGSDSPRPWPGWRCT